MELDSSEQRAELNVAEAEWKLARAERDKILSGIDRHRIDAAAYKVGILEEQVRYWEKEHERVKTLIARGTISAAEYDKVFTEWTQRRGEWQQEQATLRHLEYSVREEDRALAEAKVGSAKAKLDLAQQRYQDTILHAPFKGTVLELLKREGEGARLFDQEPIAVFGDISRLRVRAEVDERYVAGLRVGQRATVSGRGLGGGEYPGRVVLVKSIMGKKTVFAQSATERKDLDVVQLFVEMVPSFSAPIGLEVDVRIVGSD
jgi:multidrug resistance efflux pump